MNLLDLPRTTESFKRMNSETARLVLIWNPSALDCFLNTRRQLDRENESKCQIL